MPPSSKRFVFERYGLGSFDKNFCLKPPPMLWLVMLYLARAIVMPFISGVSSMAGGDTLSLTRGLFGIEDFVSAALTLVVFLAFLGRAPSAPQIWRTVWRFGGIILAAAAVVDFSVSLYRLLRLTDNGSWRPELLLLACIIDAYVIVYLLRSQRVRDVFKDFPAHS